MEGRGKDGRGRHRFQYKYGRDDGVIDEDVCE